MSNFLDLIAPKDMPRRAEINPLLEHLSRSRGLVDGLPEKLLEILENLDRSSRTAQQAATGFSQPARGVSDIHGMIGTHPEFAALWLTHDAEAIAHEWVSKVLLIILASAVALGAQTTGPRFSARQSAGLAVRRALADEALKSEFTSIFECSTTEAVKLSKLPEDLKLRATAVLESKNDAIGDLKRTASISRHLFALALVIEYIIEVRTPRERRVLPSKTNAEVITNDVLDPGATSKSPAGVTSVSQPTGQLKEPALSNRSSVGSRGASMNQAPPAHQSDLHRQSVEEAQEAAAEFGTQEPETTTTRARRKDAGAATRGERPRPENVVSPSLNPAIRRAPPTQKYRAIRNQYRAMAMRAQHLPTVDSRLQLYELKVLLHWISEQSTNEFSDLWCRVLCSLLLGMPLETVDQIVVYDVPPDLAASNPPAFGLCRHPYCWIIPSITIEEAFVPPADQRDLYLKTAAWVALPLPFDAADGVFKEAIGRFIFRIGRIDSKRRIFPELSSSTSGELSQAISRLNSHYGTQLTAKRIAGFFPRYLTNVTGDVALSCIALGCADQDRRAARLNYYAPLTDEVSATYSKSLELLWKSTGASKVFLPSIDQVTSPSAGLRIGSAAVADPRQLSLAINGLASNVSTSRVELGGDFETFHNLFTGYTVAMVLWGSGIRAVHDPIEWALMTVDEGDLFVSDKDGDEYADSRVVYPPGCALGQLKAYKCHLKSSRDRGFLEFDATYEDRIFLVHQGKPDVVTPKKLTEIWGDSFPFRVSAQRHFLRTFLRERGAKAVMVDAWLGHGSWGEEAYGAYSCLSAFDMRAEIFPLLEALMADCGWQVLQGLGSGK